MVRAFCEAMGSYSPQTPKPIRGLARVHLRNGYTLRGVVIFIKSDKTNINEMEVKIMKKGILIYNEMLGRYDIRFGLENYYGGLHCGECFEVKVSGKWKQTRIEKGVDWYLVGVTTSTLAGLEVRI